MSEMISELISFFGRFFGKRTDNTSKSNNKNIVNTGNDTGNKVNILGNNQAPIIFNVNEANGNNLNTSPLEAQNKKICNEIYDAVNLFLREAIAFSNNVYHDPHYVSNLKLSNFETKVAKAAIVCGDDIAEYVKLISKKGSALAATMANIRIAQGHELTKLENDKKFIRLKQWFCEQRDTELNIKFKDKI